MTQNNLDKKNQTKKPSWWSQLRLRTQITILIVSFSTVLFAILIGVFVYLSNYFIEGQVRTDFIDMFSHFSLTQTDFFGQVTQTPLNFDVDNDPNIQKVLTGLTTTTSNFVQVTIIVGVVILLLSILAIVLITRRALKPLNQVQNFLDDLMSDRAKLLEQDINANSQEVQSIINSINHLIYSLNRAVGNVKGQNEKITESTKENYRYIQDDLMKIFQEIKKYKEIPKGSIVSMVAATKKSKREIQYSKTYDELIDTEVETQEIMKDIDENVHKVSRNLQKILVAMDIDFSKELDSYI